MTRRTMIHKQTFELGIFVREGSALEFKLEENKDRKTFGKNKIGNAEKSPKYVYSPSNLFFWFCSEADILKDFGNDYCNVNSE